MDVIAGHDSSLLAHGIRYANGLYGGVWDPTDIGKLAADFVRAKVDLIAGAPYTQHLFERGREGAQNRARLALSFTLLIGAVRPEWFIYEDFSTAYGSPAYQDARLLWKKYGYGLTELVLDASRYEVAQRRRRLMVVGRLGEEDGFLDNPIRARASNKPKTVREILDEHDPEDAALLERGTYYTRPLHSGWETSRSIDKPAPGIYRDFRKVPEGVDELELGLHQLTLIQSFPRRFNWTDLGYYDPDDADTDDASEDDAGIDMDELERIISSAVPPALAYHVGKSIVDRHTGGEIPECHEDFKKWFRKTKKTPWATGPINNVVSRINRGRKLLGGRTFADPKDETASLETIEEFKDLSEKNQSQIRSALRDYAKFKAALFKKSFRSSKKQPEKKKPTAWQRWRQLRREIGKPNRWPYESLQLNPPHRPRTSGPRTNLNASRIGNDPEQPHHDGEDIDNLPPEVATPDGS
jgi:DNA (cytosine-5)-methyltransferase 1